MHVMGFRDTINSHETVKLGTLGAQPLSDMWNLFCTAIW